MTASHMAHYEKSLLAKDESLSEKFMDIAALGLYRILSDKLLDNIELDRIILVTGKGNNGGDAYALGSLLLQSGYNVVAYQVFAEASPLSEKKAEEFEQNGGERVHISDASEMDIIDTDLIIDGLLGTGFKGQVTGLLKDVIIKCNTSKAYVFSIDIPSGVDGNTGVVENVAIFADMTGYLGALKVGHLFESGYNHVGVLHYVDFGMKTKDLKPFAFLANNRALYHNLPTRRNTAHKYQVGQVCVFAGTDAMSGAGELACLAAYRAGCGLVKHYYLGDTPSTIKEVISQKAVHSNFEEELSRTKAILIGPGLGREEGAKELVEKIFSLTKKLMVLDADAFFLMKTPPKDAILTPHKGELLYILGLTKDSSEELILEKARAYVEEHSVIIVYKGAPTKIIAPGKDLIVAVTGNSGMATAGSGDVLSGIIVSLLAQGSTPFEASILGVMLHGEAGDVAAEKLSRHFLLASDIIEGLAPVFKQVERSVLN